MSARAPVDLDAAFAAHAFWLCRSMHALTGSRELAEDIVQDTFRYAFEHRHELYDGPGLRTWLYKVARNQSLHRIRGRSRFEALLGRLLAEPRRAATTPEETMEGLQHAERIHRCLQQVDEPYREPLILFELQGLSMIEIADVLQIAVGTVGSRLSRGRRQFRDAWTRIAREETP